MTCQCLAKYVGVVWLAFIVDATLGFGQIIEELRELRSPDGSYVFEDESYSLESLLKNDGLVSKWRDRYFREIDPANVLSPEEHMQLSKHSISLVIHAKGAPVKFDAVGLEVSARATVGNKLAGKKLLEEFRQRNLGRELERNFVDELVTLQRSYEALRKSTRGADKKEQIFLTARVEDRWSNSRSKQECWLIVAVGVTGTRFDDLFVNEFYTVLGRLNKRPLSQGMPSEDLPQPLLPHPETEELLAEVLKPSKREPNRTKPKTIVLDDGLTPQARGLLYGFSLTSEVKKKEMQIESFSFSEGFFSMTALLTEKVMDRVPPSSVETYESLHAKLGDACRVFREVDPWGFVEFTVTQDESGYAKISTRCQSDHWE
ncbi:MAG: hypothetical protein KDD66_08085 [Bdellovibrionales bacterium]|nr:hypothetical protein [Bdellovibrionales bacterium]